MHADIRESTRTFLDNMPRPPLGWDGQDVYATLILGLFLQQSIPTSKEVCADSEDGGGGDRRSLEDILPAVIE